MTNSAKEKAVKIAAIPAKPTEMNAEGPAKSMLVPTKTKIADPIIVPMPILIAENNPIDRSSFLAIAHSKKSNKCSDYVAYYTQT